MTKLIVIFCSVVLCPVFLIEGKIETCEAPPKVADERKFKFTPSCGNGDDVCEVNYQDFDSKSVFEFTAPEGKELKQDDLECKFTYYKKQNTDDSVVLSCQIGEQENIDDKIFKPEIKPIEGGETRFIACYCGEQKEFPKNEEGYAKTELLVNGKRQYCYFLDVIFSKERVEEFADLK